MSQSNLIFYKLNISFKLYCNYFDILGNISNSFIVGKAENSNSQKNKNNTGSSVNILHKRRPKISVRRYRTTGNIKPQQYQQEIHRRKYR